MPDHVSLCAMRWDELNAKMNVWNPMRRLLLFIPAIQQFCISTLASHLIIAVSECPDSPVKSSAERHVSHAFVPERLVESLCYIDTVLIRYFPERSNNMPEARKLTGTGQMDSLINQSISLICACRSSREIAKERGVLLQSVVTKISYS